MIPILAGRHLLPLRAAALAGAVVLPLAVFAVPAHAAGDNGDVKIHDAGTPADSQNNDPKVCKFYIVGLNFDPGQTVTWHIDQQPPTGNAQVLSGSLVMPTGNARTADQSLPDGHYKLGWNFVGENGDAKQKVFTVDCGGVGSSPSPSPSGSTSPSPSPSPSSGTSPSASPGHPGRPPHGGVAAGAGGSSRDLNPAEVTVGTALIAGAGYLVVRRRRRSRSRR
ncbi:hypothetical protein [Kitasatospora phosalacinea]|uniref:hypothetical protein n=1 Tax=Kitasatospora phosalacinea TaxID=2065 RepID=UPI000689CC2D|nr:hypothetical protein [Kitasatospora phosalacinea]